MDAAYTNDAIDQEKRSLRQRLLEERMALPLETRIHASRKISKRCRDFIALHSPAGPQGPQDASDRQPTLCFYWPIKNEPDLLPLARAMLQAGRKAAFPAVRGQEIVFKLVSNLDEDFTQAAFGIHEPQEHCPSMPDNEECVVFIPGAAFGHDGTRLGYGKGYFDRWLARQGNTVTSVGVAYDAAILSRLPKCETDLPVQYICSERRLLQATGNCI